MHMTDILAAKRDGKALNEAQIAYVVEGYTNGTIPDYQMSALLMAVVLNGMTKEETAVLTACMTNSGERADLSAIAGVKVDKHSTGGVGDKTTLIVAPIVAACGVKVAKMSGRGLGHTGGTIDKLEAIPGFQVEIPEAQFERQVNEVGVAVIGQSGNLAPADKKIYALRDVTATVDSIPLIASSIMSKKLACGANALVLDVKAGSGAFMKTADDAAALAAAMVDIGEANGLATSALITDMDTPLGSAVGNALEVAECVAVLQGEGPADLTEISLLLAAEMLRLAGVGSAEDCSALAVRVLQDGAALAKLKEMVAAQGGDVTTIDAPETLPQAKVSCEVPAQADGFINAMDAEEIGRVSVLLGAGRITKADTIDPGAGLLILAKTGDEVKAGQPLARLFAEREELFPEAVRRYKAAVKIAAQPPEGKKLALARVDKNGVEYF